MCILWARILSQHSNKIHNIFFFFCCLNYLYDITFYANIQSSTYAIVAHQEPPCPLEKWMQLSSPLAILWRLSILFARGAMFVPRCHIFHLWQKCFHQRWWSQSVSISNIIEAINILSSKALAELYIWS